MSALGSPNREKRRMRVSLERGEETLLCDPGGSLQGVKEKKYFIEYIRTKRRNLRYRAKKGGQAAIDENWRTEKVLTFMAPGYTAPLFH